MDTELLEQTPDNESVEPEIIEPEPTPEKRALSAPRLRQRHAKLPESERQRPYPSRRRSPSPLSFPKTKPSSVDQHPRRGMIERDMLRGQLSLAQIARKYSTKTLKLNPSSLQRHRTRLFKQLENAKELQAQYRADRAKKLTQEVDAIHTELYDATTKAKQEGDWKGMAAVAGRALESRKLAAELGGIIGQPQDGAQLPSGMTVNAEVVNQIIAVPKRREGLVERVVDVTPSASQSED